jgi:hypothetical protein
MLKLEMMHQIGEMAGKVWHVLNDRGPQTLAQLKKGLGSSSELVGFALGWLAREDKITIVQEKKSFRVGLKE